MLAAVAKCPSHTLPAGQNYPSRLPYAFSNLVWWNDTELRTILKERIKGLGDEISPDSPAPCKIRDELKVLLKEKGIAAEIQSEEPSYSAFSGSRDPDSPAPAIVFSVLSPQILVDRLVILGAPDEVKEAIFEDFHTSEGRNYSARQDWIVRSRAREALEANGYLDGKVDVAHDAPRSIGGHYAVNLLISTNAGPQYHIQSITADGGPLLTGRDLSEFFAGRVGEVAREGPFGRLAGEIRAYYARYGFADVMVQGPPVLDREHALVSYHLTVVPGPLYHLRSLTIHKLNTEQEAKVRTLLGMKPGDAFDEMAITTLYHKIADDPAIAAYSFTFSPKKDKAAAVVDLTLDFYKVGTGSSVTIK